MGDARQKHLEMIQAVVSRLAGNSFLLKGWSVTLVSAMLALSVTTSRQVTMMELARFPIVVFWILDGYFLSRERRFRKLYDAVRIEAEAGIDFSMDAGAVADRRCSWLASFFSATLLIFNLALLALLEAAIHLVT